MEERRSGKRKEKIEYEKGILRVGGKLKCWQKILKRML